MDDKELVTVATFGNTTEAGVALGYLQSEGIECCLVDENMTQILPLDFTGVKLQVHERDAEAARALLETAGEMGEGEEGSKE